VTKGKKGSQKNGAVDHYSGYFSIGTNQQKQVKSG